MCGLLSVCLCFIYQCACVLSFNMSMCCVFCVCISVLCLLVCLCLYSIMFACWCVSVSVCCVFLYIWVCGMSVTVSVCCPTELGGSSCRLWTHLNDESLVPKARGETHHAHVAGLSDEVLYSMVHTLGNQNIIQQAFTAKAKFFNRLYLGRSL